MSYRKNGLLIVFMMLILLSACSLESCKSSIQGAQTTPASLEQIVSEIPEYSGRPWVEINDNKVLFSEEDYELRGEHYGNLDKLGRCTSCIVMLEPDMMPGDDEVRGDISSIEPTGWHYDVGWERCHLIAWCLTGQNDNILNLITGSHYFNVEGMLPWEGRTANYVRDTGNHVLYRVTPVYEEDNMVASGVIMEAVSIEDDGAGLQFCVYCYNVFSNPETVIDYKTGEVLVAVESEGENRPVKYVLNTSSLKIHYPDCKSVMDMAEHNKKFVYDETVDDLAELGYTPCGNCHPE